MRRFVDSDGLDGVGIALPKKNNLAMDMRRTQLLVGSHPKPDVQRPQKIHKPNRHSPVTSAPVISVAPPPKTTLISSVPPAAIKPFLDENNKSTIPEHSVCSPVAPQPSATTPAQIEPNILDSPAAQQKKTSPNSPHAMSDTSFKKGAAAAAIILVGVGITASALLYFPNRNDDVIVKKSDISLKIQNEAAQSTPLHSHRSDEAPRSMIQQPTTPPISPAPQVEKIVARPQEEGNAAETPQTKPAQVLQNAPVPTKAAPKNDRLLPTPTWSAPFPGRFDINQYCYATLNMAKLKDIEKKLVECTGDIYVYGHSCPKGAPNIKAVVSQKRAECVKRILKKHPALKNRTIIPKGLSDSKQLFKRMVSADKNRRVTIACQ